MNGLHEHGVSAGDVAHEESVRLLFSGQCSHDMRNLREEASGLVPDEVQPALAQAVNLSASVLMKGGIQVVLEHFQSKLKESEEYYRTIFETIGTATVIIEKDGTISRQIKI